MNPGGVRVLLAQGEQRVVGITDIDAMIDYLPAHSPIRRDSGARVRRVE